MARLTLTFSLFLEVFFMLQVFYCGPCDHFRQVFSQHTFTENCNSNKIAPNMSDIYGKESVSSLMECHQKCLSLLGCKGADYYTARSSDNCLMYYNRTFSNCNEDPSVKYYEAVSIFNYIADQVLWYCHSQIFYIYCSKNHNTGVQQNWVIQGIMLFKS